ncbi:MAG TPA: patatin-like phospholipase family protein [Acidimicrobiales bacterium]|nr:patatin-like phospholipase family protein [Acidimicrobiales bacterium]
MFRVRDHMYKIREPGSGGPGRVVFALAGGGNLGAVQVGMLTALLEAGITPDAIIGSSVGAINGAFVAGHADLAGMEQLAQLWTNTRRQKVFPLNVGGIALGLLGRRQFLFESFGLRDLLARAEFGFSNIEEAPIEFNVVATDMNTTEVVVIDRGGTVEAILASSAIPGVFPPVEIEGRALVDGGVLENVPVIEAERFAPSTIYVLPTQLEVIERPPSGAFGTFQRAMSMAGQPATRMALADVSMRRNVKVLPVPQIAGQLSVFDFKETPRLIEESYLMSKQWLEQHHATEAVYRDAVVFDDSSTYQERSVSA